MQNRADDHGEVPEQWAVDSSERSRPAAGGCEATGTVVAAAAAEPGVAGHGSGMRTVADCSLEHAMPWAQSWHKHHEPRWLEISTCLDDRIGSCRDEEPVTEYGEAAGEEEYAIVRRHTEAAWSIGEALWAC
jgi:hypothetical protein